MNDNPRARRLMLLLIAVVIVLAYRNSFGPGSDRPATTNWTRDNLGLIAQDERLKTARWEDRPGEPGASAIWTKDYWWPTMASGLFRPIVTYSCRLNWRALRPAEAEAAAIRDPKRRADALDRVERYRLWGFHAVNLAAHLGATMLVYGVAKLLTKRSWTALAIALLFGLHPIATEAVTNLVGRADLFAAMSVLGGLLLHERASREKGQERIRWLVGLMFTTALGLFSKENAIVILPVVVLYDLLYRLRPPGRSLGASMWHWTRTSYIALLPPFVLMVAARWWVAANSGLPTPIPFVDNPIVGANWIAGRITALFVMARIGWLLIWPLKLSCDYSFNEIPVAFSRFSSGWGNMVSLIGAALVVCVLVAGLLLWKRRHREVAFFILFFFIGYFPTSNLVLPIGSIMAERFAYLPMVGFIGCLVLMIEWLIARLKQPRWVAKTVFLLLAAAYGARTYVRNADWRSDATLWTSAAEATPKSYRPWKACASALYVERSKPPALRQPEARSVTIDECIAYGEKAQIISQVLPDELNPTGVDLHLGIYYGAKGEELGSSAAAASCFEKSLEYLEKARRIDRALNRANREHQLRRGLRAEDIAETGNVMVYASLGKAHQRLGQVDDALADYQFMRRLDPSNPDAYERIGELHIQTGRHEESAVALVQAIWLDGTRVRLWPALEQALAAINNEAEPAMMRDVVGNPTLDLRRSCVQLVTAKAAESVVRGMLEAKQFEQARMFGNGAVQRKFLASERLEAIFREHGH